LRIECTTADASPAADDYIAILYHVEAQDVSWINYGTADAKPLVLSFYVRSNKTGSGSFAIRQRDNSNKLFNKVYAFNGTAGTWKRVEITIPADTAGLIDTDNDAGLTLEWWLNSGSTYIGGGETTGWETFDNSKRNPTNAEIGSAVSDYFDITGVQLEVGSKSTPFEHESYGQTLAKCQRYYYEIFTSENNLEGFGPGTCWSTSSVYFGVNFPVTMRAYPSFSGFAGGDGPGYLQVYAAGVVSYTNDSNALLGTQRLGINGAMLYTAYFVDTSSGVAGNVVTYRAGDGAWVEKHNANLKANFSAEL